jgi:hypothetical protein
MLLFAITQTKASTNITQSKRNKSRLRQKHFVVMLLLCKVYEAQKTLFKLSLDQCLKSTDSAIYGAGG